MPPAALRVRNLVKTYQDVVAVNGLDLEVYPGECFGLLGPNGAGKTTLLKALMAEAPGMTSAPENIDAGSMWPRETIISALNSSPRKYAARRGSHARVARAWARRRARW
mgnify:CR=1 FL=1